VQILAEPDTRICPPAAFGTGCPCCPTYIPVAGGCRNSTNQSAALLTSGSVSVATDSLSLRVEHMPANAAAILTQANGFGPNVVFGDGIRCVSGGLLRMGSTFAVNGVATWPVGADSISVRGGIPAGGATKYYYVFYRDVIDFCTPSSFNLTDMQRIVWVP
jgi:hypothetical protein